MTARWYRGNIHTHTTNSDGDSAPDVVVSWYRDAGYDFLVVTDHDVLTDPDGLRDAAGPMTLIRGEEISSGDVHVNGLGIRERIAATFAATSSRPSRATSIRSGAGRRAVREPPELPVAGQPRGPRGAPRRAPVRDPQRGARGQQPGRASRLPVHRVDLGHAAERRSPDAGRGRGRRPPLPGLGSALLQPGTRLDVVRTEYPEPAELLTALDAGDCYAPTGVTWASCTPPAGSWPSISSSSGRTTTGRPSSASMAGCWMSRRASASATGCTTPTATCAPGSMTPTVSRPGVSRSSATESGPVGPRPSGQVDVDVLDLRVVVQGAPCPARDRGPTASCPRTAPPCAPTSCS